MIVPLAQVDITLEHLRLVTDALQRYLPDCEVWAYGSRVSGYSWKYSDLDLVAVCRQPVNAMVKEDLLDELSETLIPYIIDLKDWNSIPQHWRDEILRCYAIIHSPDLPTPTLPLVKPDLFKDRMGE